MYSTLYYNTVLTFHDKLSDIHIVATIVIIIPSIIFRMQGGLRQF